MTKGLLLIGAGGHARSCIEAIESAGLPIFGLLDRERGLSNAAVLGYPVIGTDGDLPRLAQECSGVLIAVGQIGRPKVRMAIYQSLARLGLACAPIHAGSARVSRFATVGEGSIVMHQAVVNAGARVGVNCIVNTAAVIEHDVELGDHCHVAIGALIGGGARIGDGCFVGAGAVVAHGVTIGDRSIIGAGCVILSDCAAETFVKHPA